MRDKEVIITATDYSGKTTQYSWKFSFDKTAPEDKLTNISTDTKLISNSPMIYANVNDEYSNLVMLNVLLEKKAGNGAFIVPENHDYTTAPDFVSDTKGSHIFSINLINLVGDENLTDGYWRMKIKAKDKANNETTFTSNEFVIDRTDPSIEIESIVVKNTNEEISSYVAKDTAYKIRGTASDSNGISSVEIKILKNSAIVNIDDNPIKAAVISENSWDCDIGEVFSESGTYNIYAIATDNAGRVKEYRMNVLGDTTPPEISFTSPYPTGGTQTNTLIGKVVFAGSSKDDSMAYTQYAVGGNLNEDTGIISNKVNTSEIISWNVIEGGAYNWRVEIDTSLYALPAFAVNKDGTVWELPFHVMGVDSAGNKGYQTLTVEIDTDADKPSVVIVSPETNSTIGGQFQVSGSAIDNYNGSVHKVFMQVEIVNAEYNNNQLTKFSGSEFGSASGKDAEGSEVDKYFTKIGDENDAWYEVRGTTSWNLILNSLSEFNKEKLLASGVTFNETESNRENSDTTTILKVRVKAQDTKNGTTPGVMGYYEEVEIKVQSGAPSIVENDMPEANTYISGVKPINFTVTDDEGIDNLLIKIGNKTITFNASDFSATTTKTTDGITVSATNENNSYYKTWEVTGSVDTTKYENVVSINIEATDYVTTGSSKTSSNNRTVFVDNKAPTLDNLSQSSMMGTKALLNSKAADTGSGISHIILYITNEAGTVLFSVGGTESDGTGIDSSGTSISKKNISSTLTIPFPEDSIGEIKTGKTNGIAQKYIVVDKAEGGNDLGDNGDKD